MSRIRTIPQAVNEIKEKDPNTCISCTLLRRWVKSGRIASFNSGKSRLVDLDALETLCCGEVK